MAHPDPDDLLAFAEGRLEASRRPDIEAHLDSCSECEQVVAELAGAFVSSTPLSATSDETETGPSVLPSVGSRLGRFHLLEEIGRGAMGAVFAAYDPDLDRRVALKVLLRGDAHGTAAQARLLREAQAMARLSHPNVITVHEAQVVEGRLYISMEHVDGGTLRDWIDKGPHSWREVLAVFSQIGRGLTAAHRAGLVHRDVKPENVLLGPDGDEVRVRVTDFGLARVTELETEDDELPLPTHEVLAAELTAQGTLVGTPAYMSPEQFRGHRASARSDQFAFCVALYEALYGQRPFQGTTLALLATSVMSGDRRDPPADRDVPRWLRQVVLRGLSRDPGARFGTMRDLGRELERGVARPRRRNRAMLAMGALALLGTGAGVAASLGYPACSGADEQLAGIWDPPRRVQLRASLLAVELPYAEATWGRVETVLDDYARAWTGAYVDACEATAVRKVQSDAVLDARMRCLQRRRERLEALVEILSDADAAVVENAAEAVGSLPGIRACSDPELVMRSVPPPDDPAVRTRVEENRRGLAHAEGLRTAGKYDEAVTHGRDALEKAEHLGYQPLLAEAKLQLGRSLEDSGEFADGVAMLEDAVWQGRASGHDEVVLHASIALVSAAEQKTGTTVEALEWAHRSWAEVERSGGEPNARANLMVAEANAQREAGNFEKGRVLLQSAVALRREHLGSDHPETARALSDLGKVQEEEGEFDASLASNEEALAIYENALGPDHPQVAYALMSLAYTLSELFKQEEALALEQRALGIFEASLEPDHPRIATTLVNLANSLIMTGKIDEGIVAAKRSISVYEARLGEGHVETATPMLLLGQTLAAIGRTQEAQKYAQQAVQILESAAERKPNPQHVAQGHMVLSNIEVALGHGEAAERAALEFLRIHIELYGEMHEEVAQARLNLGTIYCMSRRYEEGKDEIEKALAVFESKFDPDHPYIAMSINNLSAAYRELGEFERAIDYATRAVELRQGQPDSPVGTVAQAYFNLAAVYEAAGRISEAVDQYERSLQLYSTVEHADPTEVADVRFNLGGALLRTGGERRRARELLEQAREHYVTLPTAEAKEALAELDGLLRR